MTPDRSASRPAAPASSAAPATPPPGAPPTVPTSTYRLQVQPGFPFSAAQKAVPYLASLGVGHLHLSPVLDTVAGSPHGYDVVDHALIRPELGGEAGLRDLARVAREHGMGLVVDIVPNHMAVPAPESRNEALWHVLREGPHSPYARWFDVDWEEGGHDGRILLPVLGGPLAAVTGDLRVERDREDGSAVLRYHDHVLPVRPGTEHLALPALLDAQWYRLAWWRLARTEGNYRRFFTINELIAVRVEDPAVFAATHATLLRLVSEGVVTGLRVDHPDGLADPGGYLRRLAAATDGCWTVVEKILTGPETLPAGWRCAGTTGYDSLRRIDALFVCPLGAEELAAVYRDRVAPLADAGGDWEETVGRAAQEVVRGDLAAEVSRLVRTAVRISSRAPHHGDHAPWTLRAAVEELLVRMPVYRPYAADAGCRERDAAMVSRAAEEAREALGGEEAARALEFVRDLVVGGDPGRAPGAGGDAVDGPGEAGCDYEEWDFRARFAQVSSALRAKSVEDRAFYRYVPLLSACEVGGEPGEPALSVDAFHSHCARLQRDWPLTGTVLATHDTKRSADVRARIAVLTQAPERWRAVVGGQASAGPGGAVRRAEPVEPGPTDLTGPDPQVAWTAWQTVFGLGRRDAERVVPAVLKAVREAGLHTTWTEPDHVWEEEVADYVRSGPCGEPGRALTELAAELAPHVRANVLGAALLHLTMPGVPDLYQGSEQVHEALVDPDNRAPARFSPELLTDLDDGAPPAGLSGEKLLLTAAALRLRRRRPEWFGADATYRPLYAEGPAAGHCVAFARSGRAVTVVTRLTLRLAEGGGWRGTRLTLPTGGRAWREELTGRRVPGPTVDLAELTARYPVALLVREE
ncbi:malto-oligosyltrehalose synthase [Streptomyces sp. NPDC059740]|uniref:malto-oligosyltrehalose synthase n=1 Tax=Streptomyces sp. NPDC059740 TaxID=3346926 RepID=UPI003645FBEF